MKIKKIAGMSKNDINQVQKDGQPKWMTHQDSNLMRPKDIKNLQDEIIELRKAMNEFNEERVILKANADKYERRAKYTLEKFQEIKAKEMQLIQMGEQKVKGENSLIEMKYKKKVAALNSKISSLTEENIQFKQKALESNNASKQRNYRLDLEKS